MSTESHTKQNISDQNSTILDIEYPTRGTDSKSGSNIKNDKTKGVTKDPDKKDEDLSLQDLGKLVYGLQSFGQ